MKKLNYLMVFLFTVTLSMTSFNAMADRNHDDDDDDHGSSYDNDHGKKKGKGHEKKEKKAKKEKKEKKSKKGKKHRDVVGVCHNTGDELNPVVFLTVSKKAARKHAYKHDDLVDGAEIDGEELSIESIADCALPPPPPPAFAPPICAIVVPNTLGEDVYGLDPFEAAIFYDEDTGEFSSASADWPLFGEVILGSEGLYSTGNAISYFVPFEHSGSSYFAQVSPAQSWVDFDIVSDTDELLGSFTLSSKECETSPPPPPPPPPPPL